MKRVKWYLVLLLVGILLFVGSCTKEPPVIPPVLPVTPTGYSDISIPIGEFQNQPHIDVVMSTVLGAELHITLGSNPTTGYQWSEDAEISDESIVKQTDHKFIAPDTDKPGTPGEEVWTFKGLKRGTVTILLEYSRPWIGSRTPGAASEGGRDLSEENAGLWTVTITATIK